VAVGLRNWGGHGDRPVLRRLGIAIMAVVSLQLLLGVVALIAVMVRPGASIPTWEIIATSAHQATGAALLGVSTSIAVWTRRLVVAEPSVASSAAEPSPA
jgi:heme A synthase